MNESSGLQGGSVIDIPRFDPPSRGHLEKMPWPKLDVCGRNISIGVGLAGWVEEAVLNP